MRYPFAIVFAILFALVATMFISSPLATDIVARRSFESPDDVANLHALIFMGLNLVALAVGWTVGWLLGRLFERPEEPI